MELKKELAKSAPFAIRVMWITLISGPVLWLLSKSIPNAADWIQAIGSIGAILGAVSVASWQSREQLLRQQRQEIDRRNAMHHVVKSAVSHSESMEKFVEEYPRYEQLKAFWSEGLSGAFAAAIQGLRAIPAHELGKADLVIQFFAILGAMSRIQALVDHHVNTDSPERLWETYGKIGEQTKVVKFSWGNYSKLME